MFLLLVILVISFVIRAYPRWVLPHAVVSDSWGHLYYAKLIRDNGFKIPKKSPHVVLNHEYTYPFLYHWLLALFPDKHRHLAERHTGAFFDTVNTFLVYWGIQLFGIELASVSSHEAGLIAAFLYATSPATLRIGSGPRAYNGSARIPGQTFYLLHVLSLFGGYQLNYSYCWVVSIISVAAILPLSVFGFQVLVAFAPIWLFLAGYKYALVLAAGWAVSWIATKGLTNKVVNGSIKHSIFYRNHLQAIFLYPHIRHVKDYLKALKFHWKAWFNDQSENIVSWIFRDNFFPHVLFTCFPQLVLVPLYQIFLTGTSVNWLAAWCYSAFIAGALTRLRPFLFLGEGERYLEFALFPSYALLTFFLLPAHPIILGAIAGLQLAAGIFLTREYIRNHKSLNDSSLASEPLFEKLRNLPRGAVLPVGWVHYQTLARSRFPTVTYSGNIDTSLMSVEDFMTVYGNYPYPGGDYLNLVDKFDVSYVLADKECLHHYLRACLKNPNDFLESVIVLAESPNLLLFKTKQDLAKKIITAQSAMESGELETARTALTELVLYENQEPELLFALGEVQLALNNLKEASDAFNAVLRISPNHGEAQTRLSEVSQMSATH